MIKCLKTTQFWLCVLATAYLSVTTKPPGAMVLVSDKLVHLVGYFFLLFSCEIAYPRQNLRIKFLFIFGFSLLLEIIQYFVPNRQLSLLDILANLIGIAFGALLVFAYKRFDFSKVFDQ